MDMKKLLHTFDEADEILNDKIERTNLSTIVASATASVENKKTVLIRGTGRNIEVLKVGGRTVQNGTPTPTNPVEVKGVGDYDEETGKYKIPILTDGKSQNIYLDAPLFDGEIADLAGGKKDEKYGYYTFDGSSDENWILSSDPTTATKHFYIVTPDIHVDYVCLSNRFVYNPSSDDVEHNRFGGDNAASYNVWISVSRAKTVDELKTWLSNNPITVIAKLATPTVNTFDGAVIPVSAAETELTLNTDVTPASIEATTFGDYYSKIEVDAMIGRWAVKEIDFTNTAANKLEYTGISIDIPANSAMMISVLNRYINSPAASTVISFSNATATESNVAASGVSTAFAIYNNNTNSTRTLYIWSAHEAANANAVIASYKIV